MGLNVDQLAAEALALPADARAQLADRLVESLDPAEPGPFHQLWVDEAIRRRDEVRSGHVETIPGDEALRRARDAAAG